MSDAPTLGPCSVVGCTQTRLRHDRMCSTHQREYRQAAQAATNAIVLTAVLGVLLLVVGVTLAVWQQPVTGLAADLSGVEESGSEVGFAAGLLLAAAGQASLLIAVIATGVRMGNRADRLNP